MDGQLVRSSMDALGVLLGNREDRIDIQYEVSSSPEVELNTGSWTGIARNRSGMGLYRRKQEVRRLAWAKLHTRQPGTIGVQQVDNGGQMDYKPGFKRYQAPGLRWKASRLP